MICPRINSASRIDHANTSFELLITENQEEADSLARKLNGKNKESGVLSVENVQGPNDAPTANIISPLDKGVYFVLINNNGHLSTRRFVKE